MTSDNAADVLGNGTVSYDAVTNTLTLNKANLTYETKNQAVISVPNEGATLRLELIGQNQITADRCINVKPDLVITGEGALEMQGGISGLHASNNLTIDGVDIDANIVGTDVAIGAAGVLEIVDSENITVSAESGSGIYGFEGVEIIKSNVTNISEETGLLGNGKGVTITDSTVNVSSRGGTGILVGNDEGNIHISGSTITAETWSSSDMAILCNFNAIEISDSEVTATVNGTRTNGIFAGGSLVISNQSQVTAAATFPALYSAKGTTISNSIVTATASEGTAIFSSADISVENGAQVTATTDAPNSNGINAGGAVFVSGKSNVTASGTYPAVYSDTGITISDSMVNATSDGEVAIFTREGVRIENGANVIADGYWAAIRGNKEVVIAGSKVEATSSDDVAIYAPESLIMTDSIVNAEGNAERNGIQADNTVEVSGSWISTSGDETFAGSNNYVLINGVTGAVIGNAVVPGNVTIPEGTTIKVPSGSSLTIPEKVTLINKGKVNVEGEICNYGTVNCSNHSGGTATCTTRATCDLCGAEYGSLNEHQLQKVERKEPTCTGTGNVEYWHCAVCGKNFSDSQGTQELDNIGLPALKHNYVDEITKATFEKDGVVSGVCEDCGASVQKEVISRVSSDVLSKTEYVYTGKVIQPEVIVKDMEENPLTKDEDYTVSYSNANSTNPGEYTLTVTLKGENYEGTLETRYKITKAPQTDFAIKEVEEKTYGDAEFELEVAGGQTNGEITWSVPANNGVLELKETEGDTVTAAILGAGKVTVTAEKTGNDFYEDATATMDITVAKKAVTIKAADKSVEQDGAMPEFTYTISPLVNGDKVQKQPEFTCEAKDTKTVGSFDIVPGRAVLTNNKNYDVTYKQGILTVNAHVWKKSYTTDKPATCVTAGSRSIHCSNPGCNAVKPGSVTTIPAKGHLWDEGVITKAPTCTEPGIRTCTCERCKWTLRKEVSPTGHTYAGEITKATFTKDGAVSGVCEDCGASVQREVIPQVSDVELSHTEYTYNGTNRQPKVVLKDRNGKELKPEEYSVAYAKESKVPGTYELTITLKGNSYEGTLTKAYTVKKGNQVIGLSDMTKRIDSKTVTLKAEILQGNKTGRLGYQSSNPEVASVTSWGRVTFHKVGKVEITAMTRGSANYNSAQKTITLTVAPVPTAITKLQSQNPGWLNIQYRANPEADGYQIQYGTSPDMKGAKYAAVKNAAIRSYTRKDAKSGETYYVRVRTYNVVDGERIYSNWSGIKSAEVK